jgi:lipopolysaccharide/colanic/teichoic acid biosynthesis glycosyltransferase
MHASRRSIALKVRLPWKRPLDLLIGLPLTVGSLPVIGLLATLVRLGSPGPAFYLQDRVGCNGAPFRMLKLRTMYHGSDDSTHRDAAAAWFAGRAPGDRYKTLDDSRITPIGRFLRRTNLDELPQLFNVVRGEMSLVGPRPAVPYELRHYLPGYFERQCVRPGITGLWQISARERLSAAEMMVLDLRYVREASPWLDVKILARTAGYALASLAGETGR